MSHQALLPWMREQYEWQIAQIVKQRYSHANLYIGARASGTEELALAISRFLLCLAQPDARPCGECKSCILLQKDGHPDLHILKTEEGSTTIKIDAVRGVLHSISQTSQLGGAKVVLIMAPEEMNENSANALLKGLEEPSDNTFFLLVSYEPSRLLATIRSRCVSLSIAKPSRRQALDWLEQNGIRDAELMLTEAGGAPLIAAQWNRGQMFEQRQLILDSLQALVADSSALTKCAKDLSALDVKFLVEQLVSWVQNAVRVQSGGASFNEFDKHLARVDSRLIFDLYDQLLRKRRMLNSGSNPNSQLLLEELLLDLNLVLEAA